MGSDAAVLARAEEGASAYELAAPPKLTALPALVAVNGWFLGRGSLSEQPLHVQLLLEQGVQAPAVRVHAEGQRLLSLKSAALALP